MMDLKNPCSYQKSITFTDKNIAVVSIHTKKGLEKIYQALNPTPASKPKLLNETSLS